MTQKVNYQDRYSTIWTVFFFFSYLANAFLALFIRYDEISTSSPLAYLAFALAVINLRFHWFRFVNVTPEAALGLFLSVATVIGLLIAWL